MTCNILSTAGTNVTKRGNNREKSVIKKLNEWLNEWSLLISAVNSLSDYVGRFCQQDIRLTWIDGVDLPKYLIESVINLPNSLLAYFVF